MMKPTKLASWSVFILLCLIWGSSFILMKWSKEGLTSPQIAALRIFSAGIASLPFAIFQLSKISKKKLIYVVLVGLFGNLFPAFLFASAIANNLDSSLAGILNSLTPLCVIILGISFFKDHIKKEKIIGVVIGFAGLCLLFFTKGIHLNNVNYAILVLLATVFYGLSVNIYSHYLNDQHPVYTATVSLSFMLIPTTFVLWWQGFLNLPFDESSIRWSVTASVILGVVGSAIATALFYILVKQAGALFASLVTYGIPFVALGWGFVYGEAITVLEVVALGIILSGVYLANKQ
ncbi:MAG: DMT family transporter [Bacteroidetes bacterium]|nr:DMT family transporter [Bacteroidota bacterium]